MTFNAGTATDYLDMLDQLVQVSTSRNMSVATLNSGGTGHAIGDIIDINATGATSTHVAKIEVLTVSSGVIATLRIYRGGAYTVDPSTTTANAQSATTGSGIGATFDLTFAATGWSQLARNTQAVSAVISTGGTGYSISDVLTLVGGVLAEGGSAATFTVATVSTTAVATVTLTTAGSYEVFPSNAVVTTVLPSGGSACTLTVTTAETSATDTIVVLQGTAGGTDPLVGIKTYSGINDETEANEVFNWAVFGMTAWSSLLGLHDQANISPGFSTANDGTITTSTTGDGCFVPLKDSDAFSIDWWISATGRRVVLFARVEGASTNYYAHCSFGLLNQFGITSELPFPAYVAASSDRKKVYWKDTSSIFGGLTEVISRNNGPAFAWAPEGSWIEVKNASISGNQVTTPTYTAESTIPRAHVWPLGASNVHETTVDEIWAAAPTAGFDNDDLTLTTNAVQIYRTPDTGGDLFPLYPVTYMQADSTTDFFRTFGEIDGLFWFHIADVAISSEDRFKQSLLAYQIFQNGTRVEPWSFLCILEA